MKKLILYTCIAFLYHFSALAQAGKVALVELFSETGCGACAQYDSAFNALTNAKTDKIALISYHCFYSGDPFLKYNRFGDQRYAYYSIKDGFPTALLNGRKAGPIAHVYYLTASTIDSAFQDQPKFQFDITCSHEMKNQVHNASLKIKATSLEKIDSDRLRLFVSVTENNINYFERYHAKASNGLTTFNHIFRAMLPDTNGISLGRQTKGKVNKAKVMYSNDEAEINFKEVEFVVFIQDMETKEVLGATLVKPNEPESAK